MIKRLHSLNQITGLKETTVRDEDETMKCLEDGSQGRTTGATAMNSTSSRSHAIFTIHVDRTNKMDRYTFEMFKKTISKKWHMISLA